MTQAHSTLDASGLFCPLPIIRTAEAIAQVPVGEILEIVSTDFGILQDMPAWCTSTGQEYLGTDTRGASYHSFVRRRQ